MVKKDKTLWILNVAAIDQGLCAFVKVDVPTSWATDSVQTKAAVAVKEPAYVTNFLRPVNAMEGDDLPVSIFLGCEDGTVPLGTAAYEKRGIAVVVPEWQIENCIQCNQCSYVCPHATIRPFLLDEEEAKNAPETFIGKKAIGKEAKDLQFRVQVSTLDCTGCGNCAEVCPAKVKALIMKPAAEQMELQAENWEYAVTLKNKSKLFDVTTVKGSQFVQPLLEFNGACPRLR